MIYFVEDDNNIRQLVIYTFQKSDLAAQGFVSADDFWAGMKNGKPDLVMLDIMLPGEGGLEILERLRSDAATSDIPIMMITAKSSEYDKVIALDMGADDYVTKPFGMMELMARVRALLRRKKKPEITEYNIGGLYVCTERHVVTVGGEGVTLTLKEFEILSILLKNQGRVVTREALLDAVWGYAAFSENRTVDVHISTLRQKLGQAGHLVETVRGIGYKIGGKQ